MNTSLYSMSLKLIQCFFKVNFEGKQTSAISIVLMFRLSGDFFLFLFPGLKGSLQRLQLEYVDVVANRSGQ